MKRKPTGWWTGAGCAEHACILPGMPKGAPKGLIYRCDMCGQEWRWTPRKAPK